MTVDQRARLDAIRARERAATKGPWSEITTNSEERMYIWARGYWLATMHGAWFPMAPNAEFIAHARSDIPFLLDLAADLEAANARLREMAFGLQPYLMHLSCDSLASLPAPDCACGLRGRVAAIRGASFPGTPAAGEGETNG